MTDPDGHLDSLQRIAADWERMQIPDFRVVAQPLMNNGLCHGIQDVSPFDCFHPSVLSAHMWATALWNKYVRTCPQTSLLSSSNEWAVRV